MDTDPCPSATRTIEELRLQSVGGYHYAKVFGMTWRRSLAAGFVGVVTMIAATVGMSGPANAALAPPPLHLVGKIHVLLTAQPWSDDSGHFSGFHTATTLILHFASSHGELQLLHHRGWLDDFVVTQTVPAGLSGICTAVWPFVNTHIDGNVGGFSESAAGKESATISLGFKEVARYPTGSTNCGPDLEETTHPFGGDPGTFSIPIQSTGTYADKVLTFRNTSRQSLAGGTMVVRVDGSLKGFG
jgi:hypothetical protein